MEYLAKKLTNYIYEKKIITEELIEIYQYGFQCFLELSVTVSYTHLTLPTILRV